MGLLNFSPQIPFGTKMSESWGEAVCEFLGYKQPGLTGLCLRRKHSSWHHQPLYYLPSQLSGLPVACSLMHLAKYRGEMVSSFTETRLSSVLWATVKPISKSFHQTHVSAPPVPVATVHGTFQSKRRKVLKGRVTKASVLNFKHDGSDWMFIEVGSPAHSKQQSTYRTKGNWAEGMHP